MQTRKKWYLHIPSIVSLIVVILFVSCKKQEINLSQNETSPSLTTSSRLDEEIPYQEGPNYIFSDPSLNPYTVENMSAAWNYLFNQGVTTNTNAVVRTTHYYVKFKPQNSEQYEILHQDTTLAFSDFPIESNVIQNGDYYHDPEVPDSIPTYQYTAVKIDYNFPEGIPYEIIDNLYIPESDEILGYEEDSPNEIFVDKLLNQAYIQTGNFEDTINIEESQGRWYRPGGKIEVFDTRLQRNIGMQGVRVQARRWFVVLFGFPDYDGNYNMNGKFKRRSNYSIWFATPRFTVRQRLFNTTFWINGPKIKDYWNYTLNNSYQRFAGHVFRGAYRYNFRGIGGLLRPLLPWGRQIYVALDKTKDWSGINYQPIPYLRIARYSEKDKGREYDSDEIFSTTTHETVHSSHYSHIGSGAFALTPATIRESWAVGVEWFITHMEYAERGIPEYGNENYAPTTQLEFPNLYAYQFWNMGSGDGDYTSLFINLVDNFNEFGINFAGFPDPGTVNDQVAGYTFSNIEFEILPYAGQGWDSFIEQLKSNKPSGTSDAQIDLLIINYH